MPRAFAASFSSSSSAAADASPEAALRRHLAALGLPPGLLPAVRREHAACHSQLWLLDNSAGMRARDAHVVRPARARRATTDVRGVAGAGAGAGARPPERKDAVRRWDELRECVAWHARAAGALRLPSKYLLLNRRVDGPPGGGDDYQFTVRWGHDDAGGTGSVAGDLDRLSRALADAALEERTCPLAARLRRLAAHVRRDAPALEAMDRRVTVVVCTQGRPTGRDGRYDRDVQKEFQTELGELLELPVKLIFRVCSDDDNVLDMYNSLDAALGESIDVLDDFWGEALEVYLHNPWLTYTFGMHRLRESGLAPFLMDDLDERSLGLTEILMFAEMLLLDEDAGVAVALPDPQRDREGFYRMIQAQVKKREPQWNVVRGRPTPWIDVKKLRSIHGMAELGARRRPSWDHRSPPPEGPANRRDSMEKAYSESDFDGRPSWDYSYRLEPSHRPERKSCSDAGEQGRPSTKGSSKSSKSNRESSRSHGLRGSTKTMDPIPEGKRRQRPAAARTQSCYPSQPQEGRASSSSKSKGSAKEAKGLPTAGHQSHLRQPRGRRPMFTQSERPGSSSASLSSGSSSSSSSSSSLEPDIDTSLSLGDILKQWSHLPPSYTRMHPLQHLLLTVVDTFPPINPKVEPHAYFSKWKPLDEEAFSDLDDNERVILLKRAVRKTKFFLHPDKLPKDVTENQSFLFKNVWEIIRESESATFK